MELKYPIKYISLPMYEQIGWRPAQNELEREFDVCAYITSKAYLVSEITIYLSDGKIEKNM